MTDQPRTPDDDGRSGSSAPGDDWTAADPYSQAPRSGQPPHTPPPTYEQQQYGQQPYGQQPYSAQPYGQQPSGYPSSYGAPGLDAEQEKVRSSAILWTILNGAAIFLCANLLAIPGVILAAVAIAKARSDVDGARGFVKWSWILFALGFVLAILAVVAVIAFVGLAGFGTVMSDPAFEM